ncbi:hypothetical protein [Paracoccus niistensis]|uniref:Uncharacterized protein n=1 Tax=Paracoccus niistensis TaxID=632935 RepID=A0ABV6I4U9_9RHOB
MGHLWAVCGIIRPEADLRNPALFARRKAMGAALVTPRRHD